MLLKRMGCVKTEGIRKKEEDRLKAEKEKKTMREQDQRWRLELGVELYLSKREKKTVYGRRKPDI